MTGTVLDGNIDVALVETDGQSIVRPGHYDLIAYDDGTAQLMMQALAAALPWQFGPIEPAVFVQAERQLTLAQSAAVERAVGDAGLSMQDISVVGFHGQTVLHRPPAAGQVGRTRQLGDGALMAKTLGVPVVHDFRRADVEAGGQGAPLSAIYHQALLQHQGFTDSTAVLNIGGVGNLTWTDHGGQLIGFDTGPGNAPINDFMSHRGLGKMDYNGNLAASGKVDETRLARLLEHPYLVAPFPKSLDRNAFTYEIASDLSDADGAALLTAFTAAAVTCALDLLPRRPETLIVCGGGRHNRTLMRELALRSSIKCKNADTIGWRGDAIEAECFAYLAARSIRRLPISFPTTTGVSQAMTGGVVNLP